MMGRSANTHQLWRHMQMGRSPDSDSKYQTGQINVWNLDLFNGECGVQCNATVDLW